MSTPAPASSGLAPSSPVVSIDGVAFDSVTEGEVVARVMSSVVSEADGGLILTANVDILRQLRDAAHGPLAEAAQIVVADGMPVVWASRLQGDPLPERVSGADLVFSLSRAAAENGRSVFFLGSAPGVGARAAANLQVAFPGLQVAGCVSPPLGFTSDPLAVEAVVESVAQADPDIVFVALGFPRQERLALALRRRLPRTWFLGCGGALDMASGDVSRAPLRLQKTGTEWVHRLAQEPRRLVRRYLRDDLPYAMRLLVGSALRRWSEAEDSGDAPPATAPSAPSTPVVAAVPVAFPAQRSASDAVGILDLAVPSITDWDGVVVADEARIPAQAGPQSRRRPFRQRQSELLVENRNWYRRPSRDHASS